MTPEEHKQRHVELHRALDQLIAEWIGHTDSLPSRHTVLELMEWAHEQTINPTEQEDALEKPAKVSADYYYLPEED